MEYKFRDLKKEEIDVRVGSYFTDFTTKEVTGVILLLYKDARVDMDILDETVGAMNWQRKHTRENANCIIEIWDEDKKQWVGKEDTGTESFTEKEKGLASDSFKRAGFNWGIGRELYTSPFIFIQKGNVKIVNGKTKDRFVVTKLEIKDKKIVDLEIKNESLNKIVFKMGEFIKAEDTEKKAEFISEIINNYDLKKVANLMGIEESQISPALKKQTLDYVKKLAKKLYLESKGVENE